MRGHKRVLVVPTRVGSPFAATVASERVPNKNFVENPLITQLGLACGTSAQLLYGKAQEEHK